MPDVGHARWESLSGREEVDVKKGRKRRKKMGKEGDEGKNRRVGELRTYKSFQNSAPMVQDKSLGRWLVGVYTSQTMVAIYCFAELR